MNPRQNILERLRTVKPALQQEFPLRRMALFGSWARDEQTETSDIDILVDVDPPSDFALLHWQSGLRHYWNNTSILSPAEL